MSFKEGVHEGEGAPDRRAEAEKKIEDYNSQIDNTLVEHGKMLQGRRDLSPEEKNELQTEMTENATKAKAEFREAVEKDYPELKEDQEMSEKEIDQETEDIGDEL